MEDRLMSIVVRFNPVSLTADKYDEAIRRQEEEQLEAYGERLMPILADTGIELSGEPEIFEVHNIVKR